jgi:hypothetical protein
MPNWPIWRRISPRSVPLGRAAPTASAAPSLNQSKLCAQLSGQPIGVGLRTTPMGIAESPRASRY